MTVSSPHVTPGPVGRRPARLLSRAAVLAVVAVCAGLTPVAQAEELTGPVAQVAAPAVVEAPATYVGQTVCDPLPKPGTADLAAMVLAAYATGRSGGISRGCESGGTSEHKEGRAWDWMLQASVPEEHAAADRFLAWLTADGPAGESGYQARRLGVMYVIWDRQIWSADQAAQGWVPYTGADPHTGHVHLSQSWSGALGVTSWWTGVAAPGGQQTCAEVVDGLADPGALATACAPPVAAPSAEQPPAPVMTGRYTVLAGDTLGRIALDHATTVADLVAANDLTSTVLMVGQALAVPGPQATPAPEPAAEPAPEPAAVAVEYTVVAGDTLGQVALDHATTVPALVSANGLTSNRIKPGQVLVVPVAAG